MACASVHHEEQSSAVSSVKVPNGGVRQVFSIYLKNGMDFLNGGKMSNKKKVVVGMSGGVDSSVATYLLKEQGYEVIGVTMEIWQEESHFQSSENGGCCGLSAVEDARRVAWKLDIPYYVMNFRREFSDNVISYFLKEYLQGRTPNPCIACNRYVKWEALLQRSIEIGADYIATGHYARIARLKENGRYVIANSVTSKKDQTYALYNLTQYQLAHTLMPVGDFTKEEIRQIALDMEIPVASKPDSMEICFVPDQDYGRFIRENTKEKIEEGDFVDLQGNVLGRHKGIIHYTVGQRKGLNISMGYPVYVVEIKPKENQVVLGKYEDVFRTRLYANQLNFMSIESLQGEKRVLAKIRYNHQGAMCTIRMAGEDTVECVFDEPQRAVAPGQAVVFYENDYVLGGGVIIS